MHGSYIAKALFFLSPAAILLVGNFLYLTHTGEFQLLADIISEQQTNPGFCLYSTGLHSDNMAYKLEGYRVRHPDIVVAGSSVTMNARERFFRGSFYNMSFTMGSVVEAGNVTSFMVRENKPTVLLLGMDIWWFPSKEQPYRPLQWPVSSPRLTVEKLFRPFVWLTQRKITLTNYMQEVFGRGQDADRCSIGVRAREYRDGFAPDGSFYFTGLITGSEPQSEFLPGFRWEMDDIRNGTRKYQHDAEVNAQSVREFLDMLRSLTAQGVTVIPFFQPLAPRVYARMQEHPEQYAYIPKVLNLFREARLPYFFNFLDPASVGTEDCEFMDGAHVGEVTTARIFRAIESSISDPGIRSVFNRAAIDAEIADNAGLAMAPDPRVTDDDEIDFHEIGCPKKSTHR